MSDAALMKDAVRVYGNSTHDDQNGSGLPFRTAEKLTGKVTAKSSPLMRAAYAYRDAAAVYNAPTHTDYSAAKEAYERAEEALAAEL